ncbi:hypothetical protein L4C34_04075 [Vibrio profundum]|uniref:hypothetical protein n=1 Tax=Vibrio profundum TaxID=2910247 RepID=UPI003D0CA1C8
MNSNDIPKNIRPFKLARQNLKGTKRAIIFPWIVAIFAMAVTQLIFGTASLPLKPTHPGVVLTLSFLMSLFLYPACLAIGKTGAGLVALKKLKGESVTQFEGFRIRGYWKKVFLTSVIQNLIILIPVILIGGSIGVLAVVNKLDYNIISNTNLVIFAVLYTVIGALYMILMLMNIMLVLDQGLSPWQATKTSWRLMRRNIGSGIILTLSISLLNCLALITLGLALIWTGPLSSLMVAAYYLINFKEDYISPEANSEQPEMIEA